MLERRGADAASMLGQVVGMPAADPGDPFVGLWSRVAGFRSEQLVRCVDEGRVVRGRLFRAAPHLVAVDDWRQLRPLVQPVLERAFWIGSPYGRQLADLDVDRLLGSARDLLADRPRPKSELASALAERWPDHDPPALAHAASLLLPVIHLAEDRLATVEWPEGPRAPTPSLAGLVSRYLGAFGPATVEDVQAWSGLTDLRDALRDLRGTVRVDRDEHGATLYDLLDAPRPPEDTPVPVRFLAAHDNVLVGHHDRSRVVADDDVGTLHRRGGGACRVVLVGGHARATWSIDREGGAAVLTIEPFDRLRRGDRQELDDEGIRLLSFAAHGADDYDVRVIRAA